jgi:hypothetical protein
MKEFSIKTRTEWLWHLWRFFGPRWLVQRLRYRIRLRTGIVRRQMPVTEWVAQPLERFLRDASLADPESYLSYRRTTAPPFFFSPSDRSSFQSCFLEWDNDEGEPVRRARQILEGDFHFFDHTVAQVGFPPEWNRNPFTGQSAPVARHWSKIGDFEHGDIKVIWELGRFGFVYTLVRAYWRTGDELFPELFWQLIEDWRINNPPQQGVHWKCGQEVAFRVMAWCFGLFGFLNSPSTSPEDVATIAQMIAVSGKRIEANIGYALSQQNNHGISEALGLWTIGVLFPEFREARLWCRRGRQILHELGRELIYDDGSFVQQSVNYHRLMLHDFLWVLRLADLHDQSFSDELKERIYRGGQWLYQIQDEKTGRVPYYGQNDGALILPLNNCHFRDFRPVIQAINFLATGTRCYPSGSWDEDLLWLFGLEAMPASVRGTERQNFSASDGGYYTLRSEGGFLFTRCGDFHHRPGQADTLHVDLWWRGQNIALDAGTYSYNAPDPWNNGLASTSCHNTVTVDDQDQMERVGKFLWLPWLHGRVRHSQAFPIQRLAYWEGEQDGYMRLSAPVVYRRGMVQLPEDHWIVVDVLQSKALHAYRLHWLLADMPYVWGSNQLRMGTQEGPYLLQVLASKGGVGTICRADVDSLRGWQAPFYNQREPAIAVEFKVTEDAAWFVTGFGPGEWEMVRKGDVLHVNYCRRKIRIDLNFHERDSGTLVTGVEMETTGGPCEYLRIDSGTPCW